MLVRLSNEGLANCKIITEKGKTHQEKPNLLLKIQKKLFTKKIFYG